MRGWQIIFDDYMTVFDANISSDHRMQYGNFPLESDDVIKCGYWQIILNQSLNNSNWLSD